MYVSESLKMLIDYAIPFPEIYPKKRIGQDVLKQVCGRIFIMVMFLIETKGSSQGNTMAHLCSGIFHNYSGRKEGRREGRREEGQKEERKE